MRKYKRVIFAIAFTVLFTTCKNNTTKITNSSSKNNVSRVVLYPLVGGTDEFSSKLLMGLKEVIEYKFSREVILQNYIPQDTSQISYDLNIAGAKIGMLCKLNDLNLFFPNKIYLRCLFFKKTAAEQAKIDITKKLLAVREEKTEEEKSDGYKIVDLYIDLNNKENLEEAEKILKQSSHTKGFLVENIFLKQENFLFVIKEKFAILVKDYFVAP